MAAGSKRRRFIRDERGAVLPEVTAVFVLFMLVLLGIVEFTYAMYQWNAATKAAQWGARLASVSDPVASNLRTLTGLEPLTNLPGDPMPAYDCTCSGATASCTGSVPLNALACTYSAAAMRTLFLGRGNDGSTCRTGVNGGMCQFLPNLKTTNIVVRYQNTGLGQAGRPAGPVPTITVSFRNLNYSLVFLNGMMELVSIRFPNRATVSETAEDMRNDWN